MAHASSFLIAGGGSGGHLAPGLAIAERLREQSPQCSIVFICSQREIDARMLGAAGVESIPLATQPFSTRPLRLARFIVALRAATRDCRSIIHQRNVDHVIATGGFACAPGVLAGKKSRVPVTLLNLDDPPGKANRWLAPKCDRVLSAVDLAGLPEFADQVVGLPIRRSALAPSDAMECRSRLGLEPDRPTLLITGASQGAASLNRFIEAMVETDAALFERWQILHLTGHGSDESAREIYRQAGIRALVMPFLDEMGLAWGAADVAISRAGANSVAEIAANAVPALLLPYPFHRDRHQRNNARPLVSRGAALIEDDRVDVAANVKHVGPVLRSLIEDGSRRERMRAALESLRVPDAAGTIASLLLGAIDGRTQMEAGEPAIGRASFADSPR